MYINTGFYTSSVIRTKCGRCEGTVKGSCIRIYGRGVSTRSYHILCALLHFRSIRKDILKQSKNELEEIYQIARKHDHNTKPKAL